MPVFTPTVSASAGFSRRNGLYAYLRQLTVSLVCWSVVVFLESSEVFVGDATQGYVLGTLHYVAWATFNWYVLALLTPHIYQLSRRYPITKTNWPQRIVFPHVFVCAACMAAQAVFRGIAGLLFTVHYEMHASLSSPTTEWLQVEVSSTVAELSIEWVQKRMLVGIIAYGIIVIVAGFAHLQEEARLRELREAQLESRLTSAELEKLRMQIHPHFLFNTLQAAITLVHDDPQAAEDVLLRLSELLRISFDQMASNEISLARELEFLDLYTGIQRCRFGDRLAIEIHAEPETLGLLVPPLILQPLVENAIRHGIEKHKGQDCVEIFARLQDRGLAIEVWNTNSVVLERSERLFQRGVGLRNTRARLEHLYGPEASLIFRPLARGGAAALLFIPGRPGLKEAPHPAVEAAS
ncbi:MAG: histidine kinase [Terracidiphilus sp.]